MTNPTTARHSKPTEKKHLPISLNFKMTNTRITLMIILFLMLVTIGIVNKSALNTNVIIVFIVAEVLSILIPEVERK